MAAEERGEATDASGGKLGEEDSKHNVGEEKGARLDIALNYTTGRCKESKKKTSQKKREKGELLKKKKKNVNQKQKPAHPEKIKRIKESQVVFGESS